MSEKRAIIAEHIFLINYSDSIFEKEINKFPETEVDSIDMYIKIMGNYGTPFFNYDMKIKLTSNEIIFQRNDYLIEVKADYSEAKIYVNNDFALKHAMMNLYSCYIVYRKWGLLLHSSCVIDQNKAHLFTGYSGAGKSTAAKLSNPRILLSDEASIIKIQGNEITVFDSPFRSETESHAKNLTAGIGSIQLLIQSNQNKRELLKKSDALMQLMDKVFYWAHNREDTKNILQLMQQLVQNTPVYELYFQKNESFWELIS
ncbi:hypothetical protein [Robertmurraya korlensis]|uniref:hypothetical protein n=1 Tax=Robertmurraya korlensis TaxID=519977 RepID=UPI0008245CC3|nr:hypothetical protein [Robertmurraya korlensis]